MIYLLDGHEFNITNVIEFLDKYGNKMTCYANFTMQNTIREKLILGEKTNQLIHTQWLRNIGKTHELIKFAKERNYMVLVPRSSKYNFIEYNNVFPSSIDFLRERTFNGFEYLKDQVIEVVIDEGVKNIETIKNLGYKIVTGFFTPKKEEDKSFDEKVLTTLQNEIKSLTSKIEKCRENEDFGTYKNLILAYKEVLHLLRYYPLNINQ